MEERFKHSDYEPGSLVHAAISGMKLFVCELPRHPMNRAAFRMILQTLNQTVAPGCGPVLALVHGCGTLAMLMLYLFLAESNILKFMKGGEIILRISPCSMAWCGPVLALVHGCGTLETQISTLAHLTLHSQAPPPLPTALESQAALKH
jgi:hypothetical protein